jgi:hypothetical protein
MGILTRAVAFHYAYRTPLDGELAETITVALKDGPTPIECVTAGDDCTADLIV